MDYSLSISGNILLIDVSGQLSNNNQYLVTIDPYVSGLIPLDGGTVDVLDNTYQFWFTSTYCPLFTTIGRVKLLVGPVADSLLDDAIYRMIHKNSIDAVDLYNLATSSTYSYTYWGCTYENVPLKLRRYVECKTAYDILALLKQLDSANGGGSQSKHLGDMIIRYGGASSSSGDPALDSPTRMKEMYDCWNEMLRGFKHIRPAVRGYLDDSKGFSHPVREPEHNRVIRPVIRNCGVNSPSGPWTQGFPWRRFDI